MGGLVSSVYSPAPSESLPGDYTVSTLPPAAANDRRYAWVTDLHDGQPDRVVSTGGFWKPVRPLAVKTVASGDAAMSLMPLLNSPTVLLRGTLTAVRRVSLLPTYAYPGARFRVKREALGLPLLQVANDVAGSVLGLLGVNSWADFEFDGTVWVQTGSGSLL